MPPFVDLYTLPEDKRITLIGETVKKQKLVVGFMVDDMEKADRYIEKLHKQFPGLIEVLYKGPTGLRLEHGIVLVKVGPAAN